MTNPSPLVLINSQSQLPNGVDVADSSVVTVALASTDGVYAWDLQCIGTDDLNTAAAINATLVVNSATFTATFTAPHSDDGYGAALVFKSTVNNGHDINGLAQAYLTTTFGVYVPAFVAGVRVGAQNETVEGDAVYGWLTKFNKAVRAGLFSGGVLSGDVNGPALINTINSIQGNPVDAPSPALNNVLTWDGTKWTPEAAQGGILSGDVTGPSNSNTVTAIRGNPVAPSPPGGGQFLIENGSGTGSAWTSIIGDLLPTGTPGELIVTGIQTRDVSSAAPADGYVLTWSAGSNEWVPQAITSGSVTLAGDVTGAASSNTVTALRNHTVSATAPTTSQVLQWDGSVWKGVDPSTLNVVTWANDLAGSTSTDQYVAAISGSAGAGGTVPVNANKLQFEKNQIASGVGVFIQQETTSTHDGYDLAILAQSTTNYGSGGGGITLQTGYGYDSGPSTGGAFTILLGGGGTVLSAAPGNPLGTPLSYAFPSLTLTNGNWGIGSPDILIQSQGATVIRDGNGHTFTLGTSSGSVPVSGPAFSQLAGSGDTLVQSSNTGALSNITLTMGGDLTGTYPNPTVYKIRGTQVISTGGSLVTGKVLRVTGSSTADWGAVDLANSSAVTGVLPNSNLSSMAGDVNGNPGANYVASITGSSGIVSINATIKGSNSNPLKYANLVIAPGNADYTLTASDQAYPVLVFNGGATLTADRNIICPMTNGVMFEVANLVTPGRNLTFKGSTGVGVTVPFNSRAIIYCDGSNYVPLSAVFGNASASITSDISGTNQSQTVIGIQGNTFTSGSPTKGQFVMATSTSNYGPVTLTGDVQADTTTVGLTTNIGIRGKTLNSALASVGATQDGYALTWDNASSTWKALPASLSGSAAGGDLSGTYPNPTVAKINGTTVSTAGGSLVTGKVLRVTGASTVDYGAVDLANSNAVTGLLPVANLANLAGDVTGNAGSNVVAKVTGSGGIVNITAGIKGDSSSPVNFPNRTIAPGNADYTLSASDQAFYNLTFTGGAALTADRNIICPLIAGSQFQVFNFVTSGKNLVFKGSTGVGVTVPYNSRATIYCDGTNYVPKTVVFGNASSSFTSDLSGTNQSQTVIGLYGKTLNSALASVGSTQDGYVLTWVNGSSDWEAKPAATAYGTASGDLSGSYPNPTVAKVNGATVTTAAGSLTTGKVLRVTGSSTIDYGAVDLANSSAVTGILPTGNQAAQSLSGDVTGTTASNTVASLTGSGGVVTFKGLVSGDTSNPYSLRSLSIGPGDADYTLSSTDMKYPLLFFTNGGGALTADRNVICPTQAGAQFEVWNDITVGKSLTFKTASGTGVTVTYGSKAIIFCDGTNYQGLTFVAGGDLTGSANSQTVAKINGTTISTAGGSFTTGRVLRTTGAATADFGALDLANAFSVTGVLPTSNQANQTMGGDVSGTTAAATVVALQGNSVLSQSLGSGEDQYLLTWDNATSKWKALPNAGGSPATLTTYGTIKLAGDFTSSAPAGSAAAPQINRISGGSGRIIRVTGFLSGDDSVPNSMQFGQLITAFSSDADFTASATTCAYPFVKYTATGGATLTATRTITITNAITNFQQSVHWIWNATGGGQSIIIKGSTGTGVTIPNGAWAAVTSDGTNIVRVNSTNLASSTEVFGVLPAANQASQSLGGDLSGTTASGSVLAITGSAGAVNISSSGNILTWNSATTAPGLKQADLTTNSGTGATMKIQAQNETGTSSTGGQLTLTSGTGTSAAGPVVIQTGGTTRLTANATGVITIANLGTGVVHADSSGNLTSSTIVNADVSSSAAIAVSKLAAGTAGQILVSNSTPTPTWTTMSGDATISSAGAVNVAKIQGNAVKSETEGATQDGYALTWVNANNQWEAKPIPGGGLSVGTIDSQTKSANGLVIVGSNIYAQTADASNPGLVSTGTQTIAGAKTLTGNTTVSGTLTASSTCSLGSSTTKNTYSGGQTVETFTCSSSLTLGDGYYQVFVDTSAARSITLPAPANGREFWITDTIGSAETNNITLVRNGSEKINGITASKILQTNWGSWRVISNGTDWFVNG